MQHCVSHYDEMAARMARLVFHRVGPRPSSITFSALTWVGIEILCLFSLVSFQLSHHLWPLIHSEVILSNSRADINHPISREEASSRAFLASCWCCMLVKADCAQTKPQVQGYSLPAFICLLLYRASWGLLKHASHKVTPLLGIAVINPVIPCMFFETTPWQCHAVIQHSKFWSEIQTTLYVLVTEVHVWLGGSDGLAGMSASNWHTWYTYPHWAFRLQRVLDLLTLQAEPWPLWSSIQVWFNLKECSGAAAVLPIRRVDDLNELDCNKIKLQ